MSVPLGIVLLAGAAFSYWSSLKAVKNINENVVKTNADFSKRMAAGKQKIDGVLSEWDSAQKLVQNFESKKIRDIVA